MRLQKVGGSNHSGRANVLQGSRSISTRTLPVDAHCIFEG